ncbi:DNA-binding protein [Arcobacter sp. KX21116]|uniref:DNA-binding protein n=1 Tax=Arcobacter iocasae TaxID=2906515 RepID=UPI0035D42465
MSTNYDELIPNKVLFSIKEINDLGIIKSAMCKKLLYNRDIEVVKLGKKNFISRTELIRYLESNTISIDKFVA